MARLSGLVQDVKRAASTHKTLVWFLLLLALFQVGFLGSRVLAGESGTEAGSLIAIGDDFSDLRSRPLDPLHGELPIGERPVLLAVFHPGCIWSDSVSASWASWMSGDLPYDMMALTDDAPGTTDQYVRAKGWKARTYLLMPGIDGDNGRSLEARVGARTPWVFVIDAGGRVAYQGHGGHLAQADSAMREVAGFTSGTGKKGFEDSSAFTP